ncbi:MAG: hypothetical protein FWD76_03205 [Firmicutes bacterium]|nr:hypothetical protein [Bacillota bacterium]
MKKVLSKTFLLAFVATCLFAFVACSKNEPVDPNTTYVYITDTGKLYHKSGCSYLSNSSNKITLASAKSQGYTPCSRCNPPRSLTIDLHDDNCGDCCDCNDIDCDGDHCHNDADYHIVIRSLIYG